MLSVGSLASGVEPAAQPFFIGGYGEGIYLSSLAADGSMQAAVLVAKQSNPSFFCIHPQMNVIYVVTETMRGDPDHPPAVVAYRFDRAAIERGQTPKLERLNSQSIDGDLPCHVILDASGRYLVISNYASGSVVVYPVDETGAVGPPSCQVTHELPPGRQAAHAHCSALSPDNQWVLVADLGLDRVFVYRLEHSTGQLTPAPEPALSLPDGSGPRHLSFHPSGQYVFIINETNLTMTSAQWDSATGQLRIVNTVSTLPDGAAAPGQSTAEVLVHPSGRFVYGSNRGHDSIVTMAVLPETGEIKRRANTSTQGRTPRNFRLTPDGQMLLAENQGSDTIHSFRVDPASGLPVSTGAQISVPAPACIRFLTEQEPR